MQFFDTVIVGGGAAGLSAAVFSARAGQSVAIAERLPRVGKKILSTGNGRCNLSNRNMDISHFHGKNPQFAAEALSQFTPADTEHFFGALGLPLTEGENGRLYPMSLQAASVLDLLRIECARCNVTELTDFFVTRITKKGAVFTVAAAGNSITARRVILAVGGKAAPAMGTDGSGYALATVFGHTLIPPHPSLVQVKTLAPLRALKGVKHVGTATVLVGGKPLRTEAGELLFTEYGLSGPPIFNLSREVSVRTEKTEISLNLLPAMTRAEVHAFVRARAAALPHLWGADFLCGVVQKRLGQEIMKRAASPEEVAHLLYDFRFTANGVMPWANAQTTAGGIATDAVDPKTMQSRLADGLYLCGELLDIDGDCGGYNLQWAWSSAFAASAQ